MSQTTLGLPPRQQALQLAEPDERPQLPKDVLQDCLPLLTTLLLGVVLEDLEKDTEGGGHERTDS